MLIYCWESDCSSALIALYNFTFKGIIIAEHFIGRPYSAITYGISYTRGADRQVFKFLCFKNTHFGKNKKKAYGK